LPLTYCNALELKNTKNIKNLFFKHQNTLNVNYHQNNYKKKL
jgi:hypothetical protein